MYTCKIFYLLNVINGYETDFLSVVNFFSFVFPSNVLPRCFNRINPQKWPEPQDDLPLRESCKKVGEKNGNACNPTEICFKVVLLFFNAMFFQTYYCENKNVFRSKPAAVEPKGQGKIIIVRTEKTESQRKI